MFAMSLQYLKKQQQKKNKLRDESDFLYAAKRQSFLQGGFNTLDIKVSYKVLS